MVRRHSFLHLRVVAVKTDRGRIYCREALHLSLKGTATVLYNQAACPTTQYFVLVCQQRARRAEWMAPCTRQYCTIKSSLVQYSPTAGAMLAQSLQWALEKLVCTSHTSMDLRYLHVLYLRLSASRFAAE